MKKFKQILFLFIIGTLTVSVTAWGHGDHSDSLPELSHYKETDFIHKKTPEMIITSYDNIFLENSPKLKIIQKPENTPEH